MITQNVSRMSYPQVPPKFKQEKPAYGFSYGPISGNVANNQIQNYTNNIIPKVFPEQKIPLHVMATATSSQEKLGSEKNPIYPRKRCYNFIDFDYSTLSENNRNCDSSTINSSNTNKYCPVRVYPTNSSHFQAIPIFYQVKETYGNGVRPILIKKTEQPIKKAKIGSTENDNTPIEQPISTTTVGGSTSTTTSTTTTTSSTLSSSSPSLPKPTNQIIEEKQQQPPSSPMSQVTSQSINSETNTEAEEDGEYADIETEQEDFNNDDNSSRISSSNENNDIINNSINSNNNNGQITDQELHFFEQLHSCITLDEWNEVIQIFNLFNIEVLLLYYYYLIYL